MASDWWRGGPKILLSAQTNKVHFESNWNWNSAFFVCGENPMSCPWFSKRCLKHLAGFFPTVAFDWRRVYHPIYSVNISNIIYVQINIHFDNLNVLQRTEASFFSSSKRLASLPLCCRLLLFWCLLAHGVCRRCAMFEIGLQIYSVLESFDWEAYRSCTVRAAPSQLTSWEAGRIHPEIRYYAVRHVNTSPSVLLFLLLRSQTRRDTTHTYTYVYVVDLRTSSPPLKLFSTPTRPRFINKCLT